MKGKSKQPRLKAKYLKH